MGRISSYCIGCLIQAQEKTIRNEKDERKKTEYMKALCRMIGEADDHISVPVLVAENTKLLKSYFGITRDYTKEKQEYNDLMLSYENKIWERILGASDSFMEALKYARVGNYIDFGAVNVQQDQLHMLLEKVEADTVDLKEYEHLCDDLEKGKHLVYLTDNCGEIVLDKLFIKMIQKKYPQLKISVIVRGEDVLNDATYEDAQRVGLTDLAEVLPNGCDTAGTPLEYVSPKIRSLIEKADVIIAKGQGNFETMNQCGLNVYYMFLCKCKWFEMRFQLKQFDGVLINDCNLKV